MKDNRLLDGRAVRDRILAGVAERVAAASAKHPDRPAGLGQHRREQGRRRLRARPGERRASVSASASTKQTWPSSLTQDECKQRLVAMNDDPDVLGVILQRPVPRHINVRSLASAIHPFKDIEGMNPASIGNIVYNDLALAPCTAAASVELIKETGSESARPRGRDDRPLGDRR